MEILGLCKNLFMSESHSWKLQIRSNDSVQDDKVLMAAKNSKGYDKKNFDYGQST